MVLLALLLGGCSSSANPVNWFRDATGASQNDPGPDAPNAKNLEAGGDRPYPNLGDVPPPPNRALSLAEREALTQHLAADRANAKYIDDQLRIGQTASAAPPPPSPSPSQSAQAPSPAAAQPTRTAAAEPPPPAAPPSATPPAAPPTATSSSFVSLSAPPPSGTKPPAPAPAGQVAAAPGLRKCLRRRMNPR
jgi:hypothetical protein